MNLRLYISSLLNLGQTPTLDSQIVETISMINRLSLFALGSGIVASGLFWYWESLTFSMIILVYSAMFSIPPLFNHWGKNQWATYFYLIYGGLGMLVLAVLFGKELNAHLFLLHQIAITTFVMPRNRRQLWFYAFLFLMALGCFAAYEYRDPLYPITQSSNIQMVVYFIAFIAITVYLESFNRKIWSSENRIRQLLQESQQKNQDLLQAQEELRLLNDTLEEQVQARTLELKYSNTELHRSNQDLEQFAYAASHDLQEPLRMMSNFTGLLEKRTREKLDTDSLEYMQFIQEAVGRMRELIKGLLDYSRAGKKETEWEWADANEIVANKLKDLQQYIHENHAVVSVATFPEKIFCDPGQIGILFFNLIHNALKFTKTANPHVWVEGEAKAGHWQFSVKDNGIGIPEEYQEQIFEIFRRLQNRAHFSGTGIGLSLCRKIVERHGGTIWLEPNPEGGSIFYFTLLKPL